MSASSRLAPSVWGMLAAGLSFRRNEATPRQPEATSSPVLDAVYGREVDQQDTPPSLLMFIL